MRFLLFASFLLSMLATQAQSCWYVDDNFVRKDCGIMPRGCYTICLDDTDAECHKPAAERDIIVHGFEAKLNPEEVAQMMK